MALSRPSDASILRPSDPSPRGRTWRTRHLTTIKIGLQLVVATLRNFENDRGNLKRSSNKETKDTHTNKIQECTRKRTKNVGGQGGSMKKEPPLPVRRRDILRFRQSNGSRPRPSRLRARELLEENPARWETNKESKSPSSIEKALGRTRLEGPK